MTEIAIQLTETQEVFNEGNGSNALLLQSVCFTETFFASDFVKISEEGQMWVEKLMMMNQLETMTCLC